MKKSVSVLSQLNTIREKQPLPTKLLKLSITNTTPTPRLTFDIQPQHTDSQEQKASKFKEVILQEKSANNKAYMLKVKEQDDMIRQMRAKVVQTKSTEKTLVYSRYTATESVGSVEFDTQDISKKLNVLEKSLIRKKTLEKKSSRTRILLSSQSKANGDVAKAKQLTLTPQQQLAISRLPPEYSKVIFTADNNLKSMVDILQDARQRHKKAREQLSINQQLLQNATKAYEECQEEKKEAEILLEEAKSKYQRTEQNMREAIERERRRFFFERNCPPPDPPLRMSL